MINRKDNPVEWALLLYELGDAKEHLEGLMKEMLSDEDFTEIEYDIYLGHVYQHLNRAWNSRYQTDKETHANFTENSQLPTDMPTFKN